MTQTPLQQAIEFWKQMAGTSPTLQLKGTADAVVNYLESLLPKEKEFAEKCFDAGEVKGWFHEGPSIKPGPPPPDKEQFVNELYKKS